MSGLGKVHHPLSLAEVATHCKEILEGLAVLVGNLDCLIAVTDGAQDGERVKPLVDDCREGIRRAAEATHQLQRRCG